MRVVSEGKLAVVPALLASALPPDVVLVETSAPSNGTVSLGAEVNILPAAIEAVRARGGLVIAQLNPQVPSTYGDAELPCDAIDYAIEAGATTRWDKQGRSSTTSRTHW